MHSSIMRWLWVTGSYTPDVLAQTSLVVFYKTLITCWWWTQLPPQNASNSRVLKRLIAEAIQALSQSQYKDVQHRNSRQGSQEKKEAPTWSLATISKDGINWFENGSKARPTSACLILFLKSDLVQEVMSENSVLFVWILLILSQTGVLFCCHTNFCCSHKNANL